MINGPDVFARWLFAVSMLLLTFGYGVTAGLNDRFPVPQIREAEEAWTKLQEATGFRLPWYFRRTTETKLVPVAITERMAPGLTLVSGLAADKSTWVKIFAAEGQMVHSWRITWKDLWPNPTHLRPEELPEFDFAQLLGVELLADGDLIFNFEEVGMVRLNPCGEVVWRLPYRTHHSIYVDERGHIWAPGLVTQLSRMSRVPNYVPPFEDYTIVEVSPDGRILTQLSVFDLLHENGLSGLLHLSSTVNTSTRVTGDTLHLNDVEIFRASLHAGVFEKGDMMISLRNINAVLVFGASTRRLKFMTIGRVFRQHDPDFVDGNTISIFDNNTLPQRHSRIVTISARGNGEPKVRFAGNAERPFRTNTMGKHQNLANGNVLVVEAVRGHVFEIDADGKVVWQFSNIVEKGLLGLITDATRLQSEFDASFFERARSTCLDAAAGSALGNVARKRDSNSTHRSRHDYD